MSIPQLFRQPLDFLALVGRNLNLYAHPRITLAVSGHALGNGFVGHRDYPLTTAAKAFRASSVVYRSDPPRSSNIRQSAARSPRFSVAAFVGVIASPPSFGPMCRLYEEAISALMRRGSMCVSLLCVRLSYSGIRKVSSTACEVSV